MRGYVYGSLGTDVRQLSKIASHPRPDAGVTSHKQVSEVGRIVDSKPRIFQNAIGAKWLSPFEKLAEVHLGTGKFP